MKKILCLAMILVLMLTVSFSAMAEQTLVIGGTGPLTGDYASYGNSARNGAIIAAEEINAAGGVNGIMLEVLYEDDQASAELAVNGYATLIDAGMKVCLGGVTSGASIAVASESQYDGMLLITPSASQVECCEYDNSFRVCFADPDQGIFSANVIADNNLATKIAVIYDKSNDYSAGIHDNFIAQATARGLEIVSDQAFTNQSNTDFSVQIQSIADSGAELVFLPIYAQEAAYVLTQAKSAGLDTLFFAADGMDGILGKIGEDNLDACEGVMFLSAFASMSDDEQISAFVEKYQGLHGNIPDQFAADGYDAVYAIAAAMEHAGITDIEDKDLNEKLISAMTEITVDGLTGTMTWNANGEPNKSMFVFVIENSAYTLFEH